MASGEWIPLHDMLGISLEEAEKVTHKFAMIVRESESPEDMCKRVVAVCGIESICMAMCLHVALGTLTTRKSMTDIQRMMQCRDKN